MKILILLLIPFIAYAGLISGPTDNTTHTTAKPITSTSSPTKQMLDVNLVGSNDNAMSIDSNGHLDVVQHAHPDSISFHFDHTIASASVYNYIMGDVSDTTNYKHSNTNYFHVEWVSFEIDPTANADYEIQFGFVEDVTATSSTFYEAFHVIGTQTFGQIKNLVFPVYPNAHQMRSSKLVSTNVTTGDTYIQNDKQLATILDPTTANTLPADGDMVMRVLFNSGTSVRIGVHGSYHSH